jgi:hypothetical protein
VSGPANSANVDTYVRLSSPTSNFGNSAELIVGVTNAANKINRTLMAFNLVGVPAGATVTGCTLQVRVTQSNSPTAGHVRRFCGERWLDGNGQSEAQATWNRSKIGTNWGLAGIGSTAACSANGDYTTTGEVTYVPPTSTGPFTILNLTALCQDAVTNRGGWLRLRISQDVETSQSKLMRFASSEATTLANRPKLSVTWVGP